jgi:hypothetical protein
LKDADGGSFGEQRQPMNTERNGGSRMNKQEIEKEIEALNEIVIQSDETRFEMARIMAISALKKQIPMKPLDIKMLFLPHSTLIKSVYGKCPICDTVQADDEYCQHCGQALDWRSENE